MVHNKDQTNKLKYSKLKILLMIIDFNLLCLVCECVPKLRIATSEKMNYFTTLLSLKID